MASLPLSLSFPLGGFSTERTSATAAATDAAAATRRRCRCDVIGLAQRPVTLRRRLLHHHQLDSRAACHRSRLWLRQQHAACCLRGGRGRRWWAAQSESESEQLLRELAQQCHHVAGACASATATAATVNRILRRGSGAFSLSHSIINPRLRWATLRAAAHGQRLHRRWRRRHRASSAPSSSCVLHPVATAAAIAACQLQCHHVWRSSGRRRWRRSRRWRRHQRRCSGTASGVNSSASAATAATSSCLHGASSWRISACTSARPSARALRLVHLEAAVALRPAGCLCAARGCRATRLQLGQAEHAPGLRQADAHAHLRRGGVPATPIPSSDRETVHGSCVYIAKIEIQI